MVGFRHRSVTIQALLALFALCEATRVCEASATLNANHGNLLFIAVAADSAVWVDSGNPLVIPQDGPFTAQVVDAGDDWTWANAALNGFTSGSVVVGGTGGPVGSFNATNVAGFGQLQFTLEGTSTGAAHPKVTILLPATASGGAVPTLSEWGLLSLMLAVLVFGTLILDRRRATLSSAPHGVEP